MAMALMMDGDDFNGITVAAMGIDGFEEGWWRRVSTCDFQAIRIQMSQEGARELMGRNGGAQKMWCQIKSTVSVTCTEPVHVQESLWNVMPLSTPQPRRRPAFSTILFRQLLRVILHLRGLDWMMEGELVTSEQQLQHLMRTNIGLTTEGSIYNTGGTFFRQEPLNLISHTDSVFLNHDLVSLEKEPQETPRGFIDAWSKDNRNDDDEMGQIQMGLGVTDSDHSYGTEKPQFSSWLGPAVSNWLLPSTPGGPLAEVLRPSTVDAGGLSSVSSYASNATMVSSPSGVLQRTMFSLSDSSSGCNSPTLATSTTMPSRQLN